MDSLLQQVHKLLVVQQTALQAALANYGPKVVDERKLRKCEVKSSPHNVSSCYSGIVS